MLAQHLVEAEACLCRNVLAVAVALGVASLAVAVAVGVIFGKHGVGGGIEEVAAVFSARVGEASGEAEVLVDVPVHLEVVSKRGVVRLVLRVELGVVERVIYRIFLPCTLIAENLLHVAVGIVWGEVWLKTNVVGE